MTFKQYILLAQVETTTTSLFPAIIGILYAWYNFNSFRLGFTLLGLLTVVLFHLAVNIRDNYLDYYIADKKMRTIPKKWLWVKRISLLRLFA